METKKMMGGAGLAALLALGAFAAGGINQSTTSAQTTTPRTQSAPQGATGTQNSSGVSSMLAQQKVAQPVQTVVPTQVADPTEVEQTPEPTEVAGTLEPTEVAGQDEEKGVQETTASEAADAVALAFQAKITQQQAEQTALAANAGTTVTHSSLGDENGTVAYDVELNNGSDVKVNAQTGTIISTDLAGSDGAESGGAEGSEGP